MSDKKTAARLCALAAVALMLMVSPLHATERAAADAITTFSNGSSDVTETFNDQGSLNDYSLLVPVDGAIITAKFDVTGMANTGDNYPSYVRTYVGSIDHKVYEWKGDTHGAMGFQSLFSDGTKERTVRLESAGSNTSVSIRLPDGAKVSEAELRLTGLLQDNGWADPETLTHKVGNNYVDIDVGYYTAPQLVDMDGDGDLDLLCGGTNWDGGNVRWVSFFENTGTSSSPVWELNDDVITVGRGYYWMYSRPRLVDLDQDGDHDLVVWYYNMGSDNYLRLYWNTGSDTSPTWSDNGSTMFEGIESYFGSTDFADMDGDGDLDMAIGSYEGGESTVGIASYRNDYSQGTWSWSSTNFFAGISTDSFSYPAIVDWDGDGDNDVFIGNYNGTVSFFENTGSASDPSWTYRPKVGGNIDVGTMATPTVGDINGDGYLDLIVGTIGSYYDGSPLYYYENQRSFPTDPKMDIGADGDNEWTYSGTFKTSAAATGLAAELEANNVGTVSYSDNWGNKFHDVTVKLSSTSPGRFRLDSLRVKYEYTANCKDFTEMLNDWVAKHKADAIDGKLKVPIIVEVGSKGAVKLSNLKIEIDRPPVWGEIPSTYAIDEDTKNAALIDLWSYLRDDFDDTSRLKVEVASNDQAGTVLVEVVDGRYLSVDSETGTANDNWNGWLTVQLKATDSRGQSALSSWVRVQVRPVNDPPTLSGEPERKALEHSSYTTMLVASDVDGDQLRASLVGPEGMTVTMRGDRVMVQWQDLKQSDVGFHDITVTVTDPSGATASLSWRLEVVNVNDPPVLSLPMEFTVTEGKPVQMDLKPFVSDPDNTPAELKVSADGEFVTFDAASWVVTFFYPKESGVTQGVLKVVVSDAGGLSVVGKTLINVISVKKLAIFGVPDQGGVEEDHWTIDLKPYLYNVEDFSTLTITTGSAYITVSGTNLNFYYPRDALPSLKETVTVTAKQKDEVATDEFVVKLQKLGYNLALGILPEQYVVENQTMTFDLTPYIKNYATLEAVVASVSGSSYVTASGRTLTFLYPLYFTKDRKEETITVTISENVFSDSRTVLVHIADGKYDFYLAEIPAVTVTETVPETFNIKPYIMNAFNIDYIQAYTDSPYTVVNRFDIRLIYPEGFTASADSKDDLVRVTVTDGAHSFTREVTVHVLRLGRLLQLSGIGDRTVFEDSKLVIDVTPYLYNVDRIADVTLEVSSAYATVSGLVVTLVYPASAGVESEPVTFTAREGTDVAAETVEIYVEKVPVDKFVFGAIGSITVTEDVPYRLDLAPYLKNMAPGVVYTVGVHSKNATANGFVVTLSYSDGPLDENVYINVTGKNGDFAEQYVFVHVKGVTDVPRQVRVFNASYVVKEGAAAIVINLTQYFTQEDLAELNFSVSDNASKVVKIDNAKGIATIVFLTDTPKPDNVVGARFFAYVAGEPDIRTGSNQFNISFYYADEKPPGPGPTTGPSYQTAGGLGGAAIMLLVLIASGGTAYVVWRRRKRVRLT